MRRFSISLSAGHQAGSASAGFAGRSFRSTVVMTVMAVGSISPLRMLAQAAPSPSPSSSVSAPRLSRALVAGGMLLNESRLGLVKGEVSRGKWALVSDLTRDDTREQWVASATRPAARDQYVLWASSSALRRYTQANGRGFYAELGGGMARMTLTSRVDDSVSTRRATIAMASWGVGVRQSLGRSRTFLELAYRNAIPLQTRHLHAAATAPAGSTDETLSYRSWYLGRGKPNGQLFAALGVRF